MTEIVTGARLHFGLIRPGTVPAGQRRFGGAGMMIDRLGVRLRAEPATEWSAEGPSAERVLSIARRLAEQPACLGLSPRRLTILDAPPEHSGLGAGTQLSLAVARLLTGLSDAGSLAALVNRGRRSGIGVHGFALGGFLIDGGKSTIPAVAPLLARNEVPADWRILVVIPPGGRGLHGPAEERTFERVENPARIDRLCRLLLLDMLPSLIESDLDGFGEALHEYNALSGEAFAAEQGGCHASGAVAETIAELRRIGVRGVGQSSWGPAVYGVIADDERAAYVSRELQRRTALESAAIAVASPLNVGAVLL